LEHCRLSTRIPARAQDTADTPLNPLRINAIILYLCFHEEVIPAFTGLVARPTLARSGPPPPLHRIFAPFHEVGLRCGPELTIRIVIISRPTGHHGDTRACRRELRAVTSRLCSCIAGHPGQSFLSIKPTCLCSYQALPPWFRPLHLLRLGKPYMPVRVKLLVIHDFLQSACLVCTRRTAILCCKSRIKPHATFCSGCCDRRGVLLASQLSANLA
jgi:hypothetical protein